MAPKRKAEAKEEEKPEETVVETAAETAKETTTEMGAEDRESLLSKVRVQVDFYFDDANFVKDKWLQTESKKDPEGFVSLDKLLTFNKLKALVGDDKSLVVTAVADSSVVTLSADKLSIRRTHTDLPPDAVSRARTLYVKGFPENDASVTIESIKAQFETYGKVLLVRLRKDPGTKLFKGSAFIEYESEEHVSKAVVAAYAVTKYTGDVKLSWVSKPEEPYKCVMLFNDWIERKHAKKARLEKSKAKLGEKRAAGGTEDVPSKKRAKVEEPPPTFVKGLVLKVSGLPAADCTALTVKDRLKEFGEVKFVDFKTGETEALVRLASVEACAAVLAAVSAGLKLDAAATDAPSLTAAILEGEAEETYYKGRFGHKGGGGRGGGRGRGRG
jgi:hypothetical protein